MATKKYFSQDWGNAIIHEGVPYVKRGHVTTKPDTSIQEDDHTDIGDNNPTNFDNDGVMFDYDNSSPYSSSWSLEQCAIATLPDHSSIDYDKNTEFVDYTDESGVVDFFTPLKDGELRCWCGSYDQDLYIGQNGKKIKKINSSDGPCYSSLEDSIGIRVLAGTTYQVAGDIDDSDNLVGAPKNEDFGWAFLPDEY